jgi:hypothetical protein
MHADALSLVQTVIRSDLSAASIIVAILIYLLKHQKDDCERFASIKQTSPTEIPHGFDDISFTAWSYRLDIYLWVTFMVLLLLTLPPIGALFLMWGNSDLSTLLFHILTITSAIAIFLLLITFSNLWWISKRRALPPALRAMV